MLSGTTKPFSGHGRSLGYATANIETTTSLKDGVYFGYVDLARYKQQPSLIFIGKPETMGDSKHRLEAHLLDIADKDYYGQMLGVKVHHFHRPNQKFNSIDELKAAMQTDEAAGRKWFKDQI